jgi:c-di-GMP-binding flagellar brake protein YcgR
MPKKKKASKEISIEKRQYLRLGYSRLISFTHYDPDSLVEIPGKMAAVHDLSESGVLIESSVAFEPGNVIDLDIAFEQDKIILAQGEVVHCKKNKKGLYKTGIKFLRIEGDQLSYLKKFLNNQIEQTNIPKKKKKKK